MALPRTREFSIFEDDPGFNLGMTPEAFANLGLMSLPGAESTVANPVVVDQLKTQVAPSPNLYEDLSFQLFGTADASAPTVEDLYETVLGRASDPEGLQFWSNKLGPTVQKNELQEFYNAAQPELAKTGYVPLKATGPVEVAAQYPEGYDMSRLQAATVPTISAQDMAPEPREIIDREYLGPSANIARQEVEAAQPVVEAGGPKFEGKPYDPAAYDKIVRQLTAQQQALLTEKKFPYTSTFGGPTETIADLAKRLAAMGISDIREFGMKHELPVEKVYETIYQDEGPALTLDTGKYKTISGLKGYDAERNPIFDYRELTPEEVEKLRFDKSGFAFLPSGQIKREDLGNTPYATTKYYNTRTGEEIDTSKFGGKAESGLFASSGAGEGYTNYRVVYDEKGIPVFLPEKEMSGMKEFVAKDLPGILSVLKFIPGAQIPVTIAQAAAAAYMGAKPEDILKSVGTSLIAGNMDKLLPAALQQIGVLDKPVWDDYLGKFVGGTPTTDLGKIALKAGESGLASLVQGASLEDALKSAAIGGAGQGLSGLLPESKPGDINYTKLLTAAAPAIARGELTNADMFRIISAMAQPTKKRRPGTP